jgi:AraC-like DNA-binding protein
VLAVPWDDVIGTRVESAQHFARHWHEAYGVGLIEHGGQHSASGRGPVRAYAGDLITVNPGEVHDGRPLGGVTRRWRMLYLEPALLTSMASRPGGKLAIERPVIHGDAPLASALRRLFRALDAWAEGRVERLACDEALVRVGGELLDRHATLTAAPPAQADLGTVRARMMDDLQLTPSLAELAALAGVSRFQLLRRFEEVHGAPPHAWLLAQRAERARAAIRAGRPLAQVAADFGFADQSHMTRVFVRRYGVTPGIWRGARARKARLQ